MTFWFFTQKQTTTRKFLYILKRDKNMHSIYALK